MRAQMNPQDRMNKALLTLVILGCGISGTALSATITVSKGGAFSTIQSGIDAAGPGDTVQVRKGVYQENVVIGSGLDGLILEKVGQGRVTIEARPAGGAGAGPGISVDSSNVSITEITIQNAKADGGSLMGYGILATQSGLTVTDCIIAACRDDALHVSSGNNTTVTGCSIFDNSSGIDISGNDASVTSTRVQNTGGDAIVINGDRATFERCWMENSSDSALVVTGNQVAINRTTVSGTGSDAVVITGSGATIEKSLFGSIDGVGLNITGDGATLSKNKVNAPQSDGIRVVGNSAVIEQNKLGRVANAVCISVSGNGCSIDSNNCRDTTGETKGISVSNATSGTIADNYLTLISQVAIEATGTSSNLLIDNNKVFNTGNSDDDGFLIQGSGHTVSKNLAVGCSRDGFKIEGNSITLDNNKALHNGQDGIDVDSGTGVTLTRNKAVGNRAEGIENNPNGTSITNNTATGNRIDFANAGTGVTFTDNTSGDGSDETTSPEID